MAVARLLQYSSTSFRRGSSLERLSCFSRLYAAISFHDTGGSGVIMVKGIGRGSMGRGPGETVEERKRRVFILLLLGPPAHTCIERAPAIIELANDFVAPFRVISHDTNSEYSLDMDKTILKEYFRYCCIYPIRQKCLKSGLRWARLTSDRRQNHPTSPQNPEEIHHQCRRSRWRVAAWNEEGVPRL